MQEAWWFKQERKEFFADGMHQLVYQCYSVWVCVMIFTNWCSIFTCQHPWKVACTSYKWSVPWVLVCLAYVLKFLWFIIFFMKKSVSDVEILLICGLLKLVLLQGCINAGDFYVVCMNWSASYDYLVFRTLRWWIEFRNQGILRVGTTKEEPCTKSEKWRHFLICRNIRWSL